jgi:hypothetical protein
MAKWSTFGVRLVVVIALLCVVNSLDLHGWQRWVVLIALLVLAGICMRHPIPASLRYVGVALLFAICGDLSAEHLLSGFPDHWVTMLPIPFAVLCVVLFLRTWRAVFAVPLIVAVWLASSWVADFVGMDSRYDLAPGCVGGLIGGIGLVLCVSTCYGRLISPKYLFGGAVIGSVGALAFAPWVTLFKSHLNSYTPNPPLLAFAIWQAAMGTYLYAICTNADKKAQAEGSTRANAA